MNQFYFVFLFLPCLPLAQEKKDYLIHPKGDTVFIKVIRVDKDMKSVLFEQNGKKTKYEAKEISELKYDTLFYEAGTVRLKRKKQDVFLLRSVKGKLSLYRIESKKKKFLWLNFASDLIRLRWAYKAQDWSKKIPVTIYFYKKQGQSRTAFSRSWKNKTKDCGSLQKKLKTREWSPAPIDLVQFYNTNCK